MTSIPGITAQVNSIGTCTGAKDCCDQINALKGVIGTLAGRIAVLEGQSGIAKSALQKAGDALNSAGIAQAKANSLAGEVDIVQTGLAELAVQVALAIALARGAMAAATAVGGQIAGLIGRVGAFAAGLAAVNALVLPLIGLVAIAAALGISVSAAQTLAQSAYDLAENAFAGANKATSAAGTAIIRSSAAQSAADFARRAADNAAATAQTAAGVAGSALSTAQTAISNAQGAIQTATTALTKATSATSTADDALTRVEGFGAQLPGIRSTAERGQRTADDALTRVEGISTQLPGIRSTAERGQRTADDALTRVEGFGAQLPGIRATAERAQRTADDAIDRVGKIRVRAGAPGARGEQGIPGRTGAPGIPGLQGIPGLTGAQGIPGLTGAQGVRGVPGTPGISDPGIGIRVTRLESQVKVLDNEPKILTPIRPGGVDVRVPTTGEIVHIPREEYIQGEFVDQDKKIAKLGDEIEPLKKDNQKNKSAILVIQNTCCKPEPKPEPKVEIVLTPFKQFVRCNPITNQPEYSAIAMPVIKGTQLAEAEKARRLAEIEGQKCKECPQSTGVVTVPEWWQLRPEAGRTQAVLVFKELRPDGTIGNDNYAVTIPHYKFTTAQSAPPLVSYDKGDYQGVLMLKDNSKLIVNCADFDECERVIGLLSQVIDPDYLVGSTQTIGKHKGKPFLKIKVKPTELHFYPTGAKSLRPAYIQSFI